MDHGTLTPLLGWFPGAGPAETTAREAGGKLIICRLPERADLRILDRVSHPPLTRLGSRAGSALSWCVPRRALTRARGRW